MVSAQAFSQNRIAFPRPKKKTCFLSSEESGRTRRPGFASNAPVPKQLTQASLGKEPAKTNPRSFPRLLLGQFSTANPSKDWVPEISHVISVRNCVISSQRGPFSLICHRKKPLFLITMPWRLPAIQQELKKLIERTNIELHDLPSPPSSEPLREILRLITDLTRAVEKQVKGVPGRDGLLQQIRPQQEEFRTAIRTTAPCFVPMYRGLQKYLQPRVMLASTQTPSASSVDWESHQRLLFLEGEEDYEEIGLDNGKKLFIDDVLETAQWYTVLNILHFAFTFACLQRPFNPGRSPENYRITTRS